MPYELSIRTPYPNELYHHGIKGQKWGIRRYQNPDGSLTEAGRKRYYRSDGSLTGAGTRLVRKQQSKMVKYAERKSAEALYDVDKGEKIQRQKVKAMEKMHAKPTQKNIDRYNKLVDEDRKAYEKAKYSTALADMSLQVAYQYTNQVRNKYGNIKLKDVPKNNYTAAANYAKRVKRQSLLYGGLGTAYRVSRDPVISIAYNKNIKRDIINKGG